MLTVWVISNTRNNTETCEVAELWDEHGRARGRTSSWAHPLHVADEQHLVPIRDVQAILLKDKHEACEYLI